MDSKGQFEFAWDEVLESGLQAQLAGHYEEAEKNFKTALFYALQEQLFVHAPTAEVLTLLGKLYAQQKGYGQAEKMFRLALLVYQNIDGPHSMDIANTLRRISAMCRLQQRTPEANDYSARADAKIKATRASLEQIFGAKSA